MKRTLCNLLLAAAATFLFFEEYVGLNFFAFSIISIITLIDLYRDSEKCIVIKAVWPVIVSSIFIVIYPQAFTIMIWLIAYIIMWSRVGNNLKLVLLPFQGGLSMISAPFVKLFKPYERKDTESSGQVMNMILIYGTAVVIIGVFLLLYCSANPIISNFVPQINLDFIKPELFFFFVFVFSFLFGLIHFNKIEFLKEWNAKSEVLDCKSDNLGDHNLFKIGRTVMLSLATILAVINLMDIVVIFSGLLPKGMSYSQYVHQGFFSLIFSMILAVIVMLFFFRGSVNFHKQVSLLRKAAYLWIAQNLIMAFITMYKNALYIQAYGLTYKRMAVIIFLVMVFFALVECIKKINKRTTSWHYFTKVGSAVFCIVFLASLVPYDYVITHYNIKQIKDVDLKYLTRLDHPDYRLLQTLVDDNWDERNLLYKDWDDRQSRMQRRIEEEGWQSWNWYRYLMAKK